MKLIKIEQNQNGSHANQTTSAEIQIPFGWAVIPEDMEIPDSFPFVNIVVDGDVVVSMAARALPEPTEEEKREMYQELTVQYIRIQYSSNDEYKILREAIAYPNDQLVQEAFSIYNLYVIDCKARAWAEVYGEEMTE